MFSKKESVLVDELTAFSSGIFNDSAKYQVSGPDAATIQSAVQDFVLKRTIWNTPATRNIGTLEAKNASKSAALGICRVFYRQIAGNAGISDEDKLLIFVQPLNF